MAQASTGRHTEYPLFSNQDKREGVNQAVAGIVLGLDFALFMAKYRGFGTHIHTV